jgi:hypothetical protein
MPAHRCHGIAAVDRDKESRRGALAGLDGCHLSHERSVVLSSNRVPEGEQVQDGGDSVIDSPELLRLHHQGAAAAPACSSGACITYARTLM